MRCSVCSEECWDYKTLCHAYTLVFSGRKKTVKRTEFLLIMHSKGILKTTWTRLERMAIMVNLKEPPTKSLLFVWPVLPRLLKPMGLCPTLGNWPKVEENAFLDLWGGGSPVQFSYCPHGYLNEHGFHDKRPRNVLLLREKRKRAWLEFAKRM